jgi:hypothetical protein
LKAKEFHGATPGGKRTPEYRSWRSMLSRCTNANYRNYRHYGGRGITVCERWRSSFMAFLADMGPRPAGTTLDREDRNGNYEPGNCRWATPEVQNSNSSQNRYLTLNGETLTRSEWARRLGCSHGALAGRQRLGWSDEQVLTTPLRRIGRWASRKNQEQRT